MYKIIRLTTDRECLVKDEVKNIPFDDKNSDYQAYLEWIHQGNEPEIVEIEE